MRALRLKRVYPLKGLLLLLDSASSDDFERKEGQRTAGRGEASGHSRTVRVSSPRTCGRALGRYPLRVAPIMS